MCRAGVGSLFDRGSKKGGHEAAFLVYVKDVRDCRLSNPDRVPLLRVDLVQLDRPRHILGRHLPLLRQRIHRRLGDVVAIHLEANNSASVGVGAIGSVSLPFSASSESLVKVGSETISKDAFYESFFDLVKRYLVMDQAQAIGG